MSDASESDFRSKSMPPGNIGLRRLVEAKRAGSTPLDPEIIRSGFCGWHERGYLPHHDVAQVTQFVTFMLHDSFPVERQTEWKSVLEEADESSRRRKIEAWLDRGVGECWLRNPAVARLVEEKLREGEGTLYGLESWVIMPNHVHLVVHVLEIPLSQLVKSWKGATGRAANHFLGRSGPFWQADYYDTKIRDAAHLARAIRYVEQNPSKAKLVRDFREWRWSSARLRDKYGRLPGHP
jgi:REP element-mobilizing transposase RayT